MSRVVVAALALMASGCRCKAPDPLENAGFTVAWAEEGPGGTQVVRRRPDGGVEAWSHGPGWHFPAVGLPGGALLAVRVHDQREQVVRLEADGTTTPLGPEMSRARNPSFLKGAVAVESSLESLSNIALVEASGEARLLTQAPEGDFEPQLTREALFFTSSRNGTPDVFRLSFGDGGISPLAATSAEETAPRPSPDGRWLAYLSNAGGVDQLHLLGLHGASEPRRLSGRGVKDARWAPDSTRLYFTFQADDGRAAVGGVTLNGAQFTLSKGGGDEELGDVSADGRWLAVTSTKNAKPVVVLMSVDGATQVTLSGGAPAHTPRLIEGTSVPMSPRPSP